MRSLLSRHISAAVPLDGTLIILQMTSQYYGQVEGTNQHAITSQPAAVLLHGCSLDLK